MNNQLDNVRINICDNIITNISINVKKNIRIYIRNNIRFNNIYKFNNYTYLHYVCFKFYSVNYESKIKLQNKFIKELI